MKILDKISVGLQVYEQMEMAKAQIKAATPGDVVPAGTVRGIKVFGRKIDLPISPIVRE